MTGSPDIHGLEARAAAGDADAQYRLAAMLSGAGRRDEAGRWLEAAAAGGHADALYTLATRNLRSESMTAALDFLRRAEAAGSVPGRRLAAVLFAGGYGVARDWPEAASRIASLACSRAPDAMREAAMVLLMRDPEDEDGAALIAAAAAKDPIAGLLSVRRAALGRRFSDAKAARSIVAQLERAGYPEIRELKAALDAAPSVTQQAARLDEDRLARRLAADPAPPAGEPETICQQPAARAWRNAFPPEACDYVIAASARRLAPSMIADPASGAPKRDAYRTSMTATLAPVDLDIALVTIARRMAALAGRPPENAESLSVLCYAPGQEYRPHCDWLPPGPERDRGGQRVATALLYLNADYEGGETRFLTPQVDFKGAPGDVLVFENVTETGEPDPASRHAGLAVAAGRKWIVSLWLRENTFRI